MATTNLSFSIGALSVTDYETGNFIGSSMLTGSFEGNLVQEIISTMGGASQLPTEARLGRASGEFKMTLREIPTWLEELTRGIVIADTADSRTSVTQSKRDIVGTSAQHIDLGIPTVVGDRRQLNGVAYFTVTGTSTVDIRVISNEGVTHLTNEAVGSTTARPIGNTGLTWTPASATLTAGNVVEIQFRTGYAAGEQVNLAARDSNRRYAGIRIFTASGGAGDAVWQHDFKKVLLTGFMDKASDNTSNTDEGVEVSGQILSLASPSEPFYVKTRHSV